jgi:hypothetical protein
MRKSKHDSYERAYNTQAVVEAEGSQLILATDVIATPSDANQLEVALEKVVESVGAVKGMLADGGCVNAETIDRVQQTVDLYVAINSEDNNYRRYDYRPPKKKPAVEFQIIPSNFLTTFRFLGMIGDFLTVALWLPKGGCSAAVGPERSVEGGGRRHRGLPGNSGSISLCQEFRLRFIVK